MLSLKAPNFLHNCSDAEGKKLCKKYKASPAKYLLHHYSNGEFHMEYNRLLTASSMSRFMEDPNGDMPWDEEPSTANVHHIQDASVGRLHKRQSTETFL